MEHFVKFPIIQLTFTCSKSTIETLGKAVFIFRVNNKNTRTTTLMFLLLTLNIVPWPQESFSWWGEGGGGGLNMNKNVAHHGWRQKIKKKKLAKTPQSCPHKRNLDKNINDSKYHIWNSFFENIISGIQRFYVRPHVSLNIIRVFFNIQIFQKKVSFLTLQIFQQI